MKYSKLMLVALSAGLIAPGASARQLTVQEALAAAGGEIQTLGVGPVSTSRTFTLSQGDINTVYIVGTGGQGYLVLSADDVAPAVLGYSDNGGFDPQNIPANMQEWINGYSDVIALAAERGGRVLQAPANPALKDIAPMVKTRWNQGEPYNILCPMQTINGQVYRTYTGCVATALAQVLKTYEYPTQGFGTNSYTWNNQTLSFDFGNTTFDWANMTDIYNSNSTIEEEDAVAELMYACGIASYMNYSAGGSGAAGVNAAVGLVNYFGYDPTVQYLMRDYYPLPVWSTMIHEELSKGHPIYYDGANASVGHAFVLDGYRSADGFFHVNWGWGGMSDGYFSIVTLDPDAQGIGGSTEGYFSGQSGIFNLKPAEEGSNEIAPVFYCQGLNTETRTYTRDQDVEIGSENGGFFNYSLGDMTVKFGLKLTASNGTTEYSWWSYGNYELGYGYGFRIFDIKGSDFPNVSGEYMAEPCVQAGNNVYEIPCPAGMSSKLKVTIDGNNITVAPVPVQRHLTASGFDALTPFYRNRLAIVELTVANSGDEYYGSIDARLYDSSNKMINLGTTIVDLLDGESQTVSFSGSLPFGVKLGAGELKFFDDNGEQIGESYSVNIEKAPSGDPVLTISNVMAPCAVSGLGTEQNPYVVNADNVEITANVSNASGYFFNSLRIYFFDGSGSSSTYLQARLIPITAGETKVYSFRGDMSGALEKGVTYACRFAELKTNSVETLAGSPVFYVTVSDQSGIATPETGSFGVSPNPVEGSATVSAPAAITGMQLYNISGALCGSYEGSGDTSAQIDLTDKAAGQYFLKVTAGEGETATLRIIKK